MFNLPQARFLARKSQHAFSRIKKAGGCLFAHAFKGWARSRSSRWASASKNIRAAPRVIRPWLARKSPAPGRGCCRCFRSWRSRWACWSSGRPSPRSIGTGRLITSALVSWSLLWCAKTGAAGHCAAGKGAGRHGERGRAGHRPRARRSRGARSAGHISCVLSSSAPRSDGRGIFWLTIYLILGALLSGYLWAFIQDVPLLPGDYFRQLACDRRYFQNAAPRAQNRRVWLCDIAIKTPNHGLAQPLQLGEVSQATVRPVAPKASSRASSYEALLASRHLPGGLTCSSIAARMKVNTRNSGYAGD